MNNVEQFKKLREEYIKISNEIDDFDKQKMDVYDTIRKYKDILKKNKSSINKKEYIAKFGYLSEEYMAIIKKVEQILVNLDIPRHVLIYTRTIF
ncbi:hypothetical protein HOG21_00620 [bacterium]|jgi:hypothetical protein|nr:hypothetical protein [bacterium]